MYKFKRRVLLVEDEPDAQNVVKVFLEHEGVEVVAVSDGMHALLEYHKAFQENNCFPIIILDIALATAHDLPSIDGFSVGNNIRTIERNSNAVPRAFHIYYTGYPEHVYKEQLLGVGADAFITKTEPLKLIETVLEQLNKMTTSGGGA